MITNIQLVNYCKKMIGHPYWYGCFGQISTKELYKSKKKQYPIQYTWACPINQLNKRVFDCVGLIKGAIWSNADENKNPKYNAVEDVSANGMYEACKIKSRDIKTLPETAGILVFKNGHVGVYIGNGKVIEAKGHNYGVVLSELKKSNFDKWGFCPFIKYIENNSVNAPKKPENDKSNVKYYPKCKEGYKSIVDALESIGVDSRYTNRKKIAEANGIKGYKGSYQQNIDMLNMLKAGKLKKI